MTQGKWVFDKKQLRQTPSQADGIDYLTELRYRKEGAKFIQATVKGLELTHHTMATGCVFYHRFYMYHSFEKFNRWVMAAACFFLAGKVEETPKLSKDIVRTAKNYLSGDQFKGFGPNPVDEMLLYEKMLLQTIKFDFNVVHPYSFIVKYVKQFKGEKQRRNELLQMAWTYCNESFCTPLSLHYPPDVIAGALLCLSSKHLKFPIALTKDALRDELFEQVNLPWWGHLIESSHSAEDMEEVMGIMTRLSEEKADLYEDEVDVTNSDENSDIDVEEDAPPPPPSRKRPSGIPMLGDGTGAASDLPPPPPRKHSRKDALYDPHKGYS